MSSAVRFVQLCLSQTRRLGQCGPTGGGGGHGDGVQLLGVLVRALRQCRGGGVGALLQRGGAYLAGVGPVHQKARS